MKVVERGRSDVFEMRGGGGPVSIVGLPFLVVGLVVGALSLGVVPVGNGPPAIVALAFALPFTAVGAGLVFGRRGCIIDQKRRHVVTWWGLLVPFRRTEQKLADFSAVSITREVRRSNNSTYTVYPVRLEGEGAKVSLGDLRADLEARTLAESVAKFTGLPLSDASSGTARIRAADELDESLREHLLKTGEGRELPPAPDPLQSRIRHKDNKVMIEIPGPGSNAVVKVALAALALFELVFIGVVLVVFLRASVPTPVLIAVLAAVPVFVAIPLLIIRKRFRAKGAPSRLIVSPDDGLKFERKGSKPVHIPTAELEELLLPDYDAAPAGQADLEKLPPVLRNMVASVAADQLGITARSDKQVVRFGGHLPRKEVQYIHAVIQHVLAS